MKIVRLEGGRINDPGLLDKWDELWAVSYEARLRITLARQEDEPITIEMMQAYDRARNDERNFFWDNFWVKHDGL